jgi:hypothetical protein
MDQMVRTVMTGVVTALFERSYLAESAGEVTDIMNVLEREGYVTTVLESVTVKRGPKSEGPTQSDLRETCKSMRLPVTGNKEVLALRIAECRSGSKRYQKSPTTTELKSRCQELRLPISGTKQTLMDRLASYEDGSLEGREDSQQELKTKCQALGWPITGNKSVLMDYLARAAAGESAPTSARGPSTKDLKQEAASLGCPITGNKTVLQERIALAKSKKSTDNLVVNHLNAVVSASPTVMNLGVGKITENGFEMTSEVVEMTEEAVEMTTEVDEPEIDVEELSIDGETRYYDTVSKLVYESLENAVPIGTWDGSVLTPM